MKTSMNIKFLEIFIVKPSEVIILFIICCVYVRNRKQNSKIISTESDPPGDTSTEISESYEEYGHENSYEKYKPDDLYEDYIEKYQDYHHFRKLQKESISCNSISDASIYASSNDITVHQHQF